MRLCYLLLASLLLQGAIANQANEKPDNEDEATKQQDAKAEKEVFDQDGENGQLVKAAEVDVHNGQFERDNTNTVDIHHGAMEEIVQELQKQVEEGDELPQGDVSQKIEQVAKEYLNGNRTGPISIQNTDLELGPTSGNNTYRSRRQVVSRSSRWTNGIIPYSFTHAMAGERLESASGQANIMRAFKYMESVCCLKFPKWTSTLNQELNRTEPHFIRYIKTSGCWSFVGMGAGYRTNYGQGLAACGDYGVAIHEILHAAGYAHEQNRGDRAKFVEMFPENAAAKKKKVPTATLR